MNTEKSSNSQTTETLLEFPCEFPIKVMGKNKSDFLTSMCNLIEEHIDHTIDIDAITSRPSRSGKYSALTITITAKSKIQLDTIYQALYAHEDVHMTL